MDNRGKPLKPNKLNDLYSKEWLKFQKSWFIHNPPPRRKEVLRHPAKFPEALAEEFIRFFTRTGEVVFDPMAGTGSAVIAAVRSGRTGIGIELEPQYAAIAQQWLAEEAAGVDPAFEAYAAASRIIEGDAAKLDEYNFPVIDYCITSPPYWDMLRQKGFENQKERSKTQGLDVYYSDNECDLGNISDYDAFIAALVEIYRILRGRMRNGAYLTVIVKNIKKGGTIYPLAWDLGREVGRFYRLKDEKIWCQDNQRLAPYGMGKTWVSNTMHHYCLNFRCE